METELAMRLRKAAEALEEMADAQGSERLRGKAEGVRLALSYLEERKRELLRHQQQVLTTGQEMLEQARTHVDGEAGG